MLFHYFSCKKHLSNFHYELDADNFFKLKRKSHSSQGVKMRRSSLKKRIPAEDQVTCGNYGNNDLPVTTNKESKRPPPLPIDSRLQREALLVLILINLSSPCGAIDESFGGFIRLSLGETSVLHPIKDVMSWWYFLLLASA